MTIRPHRDAGPDGVTVITSTHAEDSGYAGFTDAELDMLQDQIVP